MRNFMQAKTKQAGDFFKERAHVILLCYLALEPCANFAVGF